MDVITIRAMEESDKPFILSTWLKGQRFGCKYFGLMEPDSYYTNYKRILENILLVATIRVACLTEDPDIIIGYSVVSNGLINWVYVKGGWRRRGVANKLIVGPYRAFSGLSRIGLELANKRGWVFDPFSA